MRRTGNMVISGILVITGGLMFWFTKQFTFKGLSEFGAGFWPRILAALLIIFSGTFFVQSLLSKDPAMNEVVIDWKSEGMKRVYGTVGVLALFCVVVHFLGLVVGIFAMILGIMLVMKERRIPMLGGFSVGFALFVYLVFQVALKVNLPSGVLF